jgi:hypothetical protein
MMRRGVSIRGDNNDLGRAATQGNGKLREDKTEWQFFALLCTTAPISE